MPQVLSTVMTLFNDPFDPNPKLIDFGAKCRSSDPEAFSGLGLIASGFIEYGGNKFAFNFFNNIIEKRWRR